MARRRTPGSTPLVLCPATGKRRFTEHQSIAEAQRLTTLIQPSHNYFCEARPPCGDWHVGRDQEFLPKGPSTYFHGDGTPRTIGNVARIVPPSTNQQKRAKDRNGKK